MSKQVLKITVGFTLLFSILFLGCRKDDSFTPVQVVSVEEKLVGYWEINKVDVIGDLVIGGIPVQVTATEKEKPEGYYELTADPNEYTYDIKATLTMEALGGTVKQDHSYDDKDAGTWEVSSDEKSVLFKGNQGIDQQVYFTHSDTNGVLYMELALPVDMVIKGYDFDGTVFVNMTKTQ